MQKTVKKSQRMKQKVHLKLIVLKIRKQQIFKGMCFESMKVLLIFERNVEDSSLAIHLGPYVWENHPTFWL